MAANGLVPARFLTLISHMVLTIVIFWSKNSNILACLPQTYSNSQYSLLDTQLIIGLSVSLGLFAFELIGFLAGISMFVSSQALLSLAAHASGSITLAYFMMESWPCYTFWYIFGFCVCLPALTEIIVFIAVCSCRKGVL